MQVSCLYKIWEVRDEGDGECCFFNSQDGIVAFQSKGDLPILCNWKECCLQLLPSQLGQAQGIQGKEMRGAIS